jgi:hypothetical protein
LEQPLDHFVWTERNLFQNPQQHPHIRQGGRSFHIVFVERHARDLDRDSEGRRWQRLECDGERVCFGIGIDGIGIDGIGIDGIGIDGFGIDGFGGIRGTLRGILLWSLVDWATSPTIERLLGFAPFRSLNVLTASPPSVFSSVMQSTAEGTVQILSAGIAGMSEKPNSAVPTEHEAGQQIGILDGLVERLLMQIGILDGLVECLLILLNELAGAILSMPIGTKRETFRQSDNKNARFSVKMRMLLNISSSYPLEADASRWRMRIFYARRCVEPDDSCQMPTIAKPSLSTQSLMLTRTLRIHHDHR